MKKPLQIPKFENEDEEFAFWSNLDLTEYFEPSDFKKFVLSDFMKTHKTRPVTLRLPEDLIARAKEKAQHLDIPYQRLMRQYITKGLEGK